MNFVHSRANIVHTDIKPDNVFVTITDNDALREVKDFLQNRALPGRYGKENKRYIYQSVSIIHPMSDIPWGRPVLGDFGELCITEGMGDRKPRPMTSEAFRSPETRLDMPWNSSVDIWAVAILVRSLLHNKFLFDVKDEDERKFNVMYLAEMQQVLGPPPLDFLRRSETSLLYWNGHGQWRHIKTIEANPKPKGDRVDGLEGTEKEEFLSFIRCMIAWKPENRKTARQWLDDPWLTSQN